jgi:outer membrane protein OmpA-like peptidoglycan-associated protein/ABC-type nitrate/sulfonate/bicarbonate transport system substrate-binding protein
VEKLTALSKLLIAGILAGSGFTAFRTYGSHGPARVAVPETTPPAASQRAAPPPAKPTATTKFRPVDGRPIRVALSQWPGHVALLIGAGGLRTQPNSIAARAGLDLEIVFIEDAPSKNKALKSGEVDFAWQTVDELPITLGAYKEESIEAKVFLQLDWSQGGDACVATREVQKVEDIAGKKSATLMFSPDHTLFEFMINNSRLTREQVAEARKNTAFSLDDPTFSRVEFAAGRVDVACLWEPDVTLALASRPGAHRLFSTADATELVADVLLARRDLLDAHPEVAEKVAKVWFDSVTAAELNRPAAARLISSVASRFRDELGYEKTLSALTWAKWSTLSDNVKLFGLDGSAPAFDRVYNQADGIWIDYPQAAIEDRFAPVMLRDDRAVRKIWEAAGRPSASATQRYEPELARTGVPVFTKPVSINFASGSYELSPEAIAAINQHVLPELEIAKGMYARIEGNTDSIGDRKGNQALSQLRAQAIVDYLVKRGIPVARLVARGNGAAAPVAGNDTPEGRAQNRRTEILFIRGTKG